MKIFSWIIIFLFISQTLNAGTPEDVTGARSASLANASVTLSDEWSINSNPAGMAFLKKLTAGAGYERRFNLKELSTKGAVFVAPFKPGVFGLSFSSFGFSNYSENVLGLAYARAFGESLSFSLKFNYLSINQGENYGNRGFFTAEAGFLARITKRITVGAHVYNPNRTLISSDVKEYLPAILRIGLNYKASEKVFIAIEGYKNDMFKPEFRSGIEYHIVPQLFLRAGVSTNPNNNSAGFGLLIKKMKLDVSVSYHRVLGYTPQLSLGYEF